VIGKLQKVFCSHQRVIKVGVLLAAAFVAAMSRSEAADLWDFIRVGQNYASSPKWEVRTGKAQVEIRGDQIEIRASYNDTANNDALPDLVNNVSIVIRGTLGIDHTIKATCTFLNTDANPIPLNGRYLMRTDSQTWGTKRKIIAFKEVVFPHPPNREFLGFLARDVRDE
jgi:hypothetical protein